MTTQIQTPGASSALSAVQSAAARTTGAANSTDASSQFLTMLVAQLKNQDPLNPMDNAQITSQLAQLSTVDGINRLNTTLTAMSLSADASQALQAASLVGKHVMVEGNALQLSSGEASAAYTLPSPADEVSVSVSSASGEVVYAAQLGAQPAGLSNFTWNGRTAGGASAAEGQYTFTITASAGGANLKATPLSLGRVDGVTPTANGASLRLGGLGTAPLADVQYIY